MIEQLLREVQAVHLAGRPRRGRWQLADASVARDARLAQPGDRVQRRSARIGQVRVGAVVEQHRCGFVERVDDRDVERARGIVRREIVRVRAVIEQEPHRFDLGVADREQQRREPRLRLRGDVRARRNQRARYVDVAFARGPHQGRLPSPRLGSVDLDAMREQRFDGADVAAQRRAHQWRLSFAGKRVRIGAGLKEPLDGRGITVVARKLEWRDVEPIRGGRRRARVEQDLNHVQIIDLCRPMQRRGAVAFGCSDVCAAVE